MKTFKTYTITFLALSLLLITSPANAVKPPVVTCSDLPEMIFACEAHLLTLCIAIEGANEQLNQKDKDSMIGKVYGAAVKINQDKIDDAAQKLGDLQSKLEYQLIPTLYESGKRKINASDADDISDTLILAQMCVDDPNFEAGATSEPDASVTQESTTQSEPVVSTTEETTTVLEPAPDATQDTTTVSEPTTTVKKKTSMQ